MNQPTEANMNQPTEANINAIRAYLRSKQVGDEFTAAELQAACNLTADVRWIGRTLRTNLNMERTVTWVRKNARNQKIFKVVT